jgi:hypothetical protein
MLVVAANATREGTSMSPFLYLFRIKEKEFVFKAIRNVLLKSLMEKKSGAST